MQFWKRVLWCVPLLLMANAVWLCRWQGVWAVAVLLPAAVLSAAVQIRPCAPEPHAVRRLRILRGGYELLALFAFCFLAQAGFLGCAFAPKSLAFWVNMAVSLVVLFLLLLNGMCRIFLCSSQIGVVWRVLLILFWWTPGLNFWLVFHAFTVARREYRFELAHLERTAVRASSELCKTRYPILLVHGIFFRDWQMVDYWGRIPRALQANGAKIFYGKQQSADAVSRSAEELCEQILRIVETEGCEKVNIIAHSKGGLDARYAISHYGMENYVASLTTINTPHRGCNFADLLLRLLPEGLVRFLAGRYNALYRKLGDVCPDFEKGVRDLTAARCAERNRVTPDSPKVYYQSVMSRLQRAAGAMFPMNLCCLLIKKLDGDNDGLVAVDSAIWGEYLGVVETPYRVGISHGDIVDLLRKDLKGFDVREYYIRLVNGLKERGL